MPLAHFDGADIAGVNFCFGTVVIHKSANAFQDIVGFCVAHMLMPADGAVGFYDDTGKHGAVAHQVFPFQNVVDLYAAFAVSQAFYCNDSFFFDHNEFSSLFISRPVPFGYARKVELGRILAGCRGTFLHKSVFQTDFEKIVYDFVIFKGGQPSGKGFVFLCPVHGGILAHEGNKGFRSQMLPHPVQHRKAVFILPGQYQMAQDDALLHQPVFI